MRQTLFYIPHEFAGLPLFGPNGWLLLFWIGGCLVTLFLLVRKQGWTKDTKSFLPFIAIVGVAIAFVLPLVEVQGQGLPIRGYGIFLLIATVSGVALAVHRARRVGLAPDVIFSLAFSMFIGGILGARLFFIIQYWNPPPPAEGIYDPNSLRNTIGNMVNFVEGGLVVYGSLIGAAAAAIWFLRRQHLPILPIADLVAPSLALGLAIGRIGCLMNGCCYGGVCDHAWAISFPPESPPYFDQHRNGLYYGFQLGEDDQGHPIVKQLLVDGPAARAGLTVGERIQAVGGEPTETKHSAQYWLGHSGEEVSITTSQGSYRWSIGELPHRTLPIHPTQIYSAINALLLCGVTLAHFPYRRRDGETFGLLIGMYAITRFLLELIRTDEPGQWGTSLTISQIISMGTLIGTVALGVYLARQPRGSFWPRSPVNSAVESCDS